MALRIIPQPGGVIICVKVVPGASRDRIVGELGDALKVAVSKPPQRGAANEAVVALIAEMLGVARASVTIVRGHTNAHKQVLVRGITAEQFRRRVVELIG